MKKHVFDCLGRRIELWTHAEPDHLAGAIGRGRTFYELDLLMKCREIYLPGTTVLDVGANIGNHTVFFSAILGARVHAFEPFPANQELLELNLAANGLEERVTLHRCAVAAQDGHGRTLDPRLANNFGTVRVQLGDGDVAVRSLDSLDLAGPIGLLKIDVEGGEAAVVRGASTMIATWLPDIMVEAEDTADFKAVADVLLRFGYIPRGRYAWTATYLFVALNQADRMHRVLAALA